MKKEAARFPTAAQLGLFERGRLISKLFVCRSNGYNDGISADDSSCAPVLNRSRYSSKILSSSKSLFVGPMIDVGGKDSLTINSHGHGLAIVIVKIVKLNDKMSER